MFGYVIVNKPELKIKDYEHYREYYCGMCQALHRNHGIKSQITLSYDAVFAAVLLTALYEPKTKRYEKKCIVHPGKKQCLGSTIIDYVSDMNLLLSYYKCLDDWHDDKNAVRLAYSSVIRKHVREIAEKYPEKTNIIRRSLKRLGELEKARNYNIDMLAGTFGDIMSEILAVNMQDICGKKDLLFVDWSRELRTLGYQLGKFIYILDAFDDVEEDIKKDRFNPFSEKYITAGQKNTIYEFEEEVKNLLMMVATDMAKSYERLPIIDEVALLRNIIYSGIWTSFYSICEKRRDRREKNERSI